MLNTLSLTRVGPAPELTIDLASRLNVFTGDNGLGKSFVLDVAWWALTGSWAGAMAAPAPNVASAQASGKGHRASIAWTATGKTGPSAPKVSTFDRGRGVWKRPASRPTMPGLILYARVDGSFSVWDPARNYWKQWAARDIDDPDRPEAYHFDRDEVWYGLSLDREAPPVTEGLLRDWVRWQLKSKAGEVGDIDPFVLLTAALEALSPDADEVLRPGPTVRPLGATRDEPSLIFEYGTVPVRHASAGVRRILALAYLLVWTWYEHHLAAAGIGSEPTRRITVLIDEVETHLHPQWQRRLLPALTRVLEELAPDVRVQAILTTHSPLVLASLEPEFDREQDRLFLFEQASGRVSVRSLPWTPYGDAVGWLLSPVFSLEQARSVPAERAIEAAEALMRGEVDALPPSLQTAEDIDAELRRVLPDDDVFWPRWIPSTQRYGV